MLDTWNPAARRAMAVLACVCFLAQQLVIPLHLALAPHTWGEAAGRGATTTAAAALPHEHGGAWHVHDAAPAEEDDVRLPGDEDPHPPHPADEHHLQQAGPVASPTAPSIELHALLPAAFPRAADGAAAALSPVDPAPPAQPPPRTDAAPRAPPIAA